MTKEPIPDSYEEAMTSPQVSEWKSAMQKKLIHCVQMKHGM